MRNYQISFRLLTRPTTDLMRVVSHALEISYKRSERLCHKAADRADLKINVSAEQLGNLQAMRIMENRTDSIRYLCDVEELKASDSKIVELREGLRSLDHKKQ